MSRKCRVSTATGKIALPCWNAVPFEVRSAADADPSRPVICCSLGHCESGPAVASGDAIPRVKGRVIFKSGLFHPVGAGFRGEPEQCCLLLLLVLRVSGAAASPPRSLPVHVGSRSLTRSVALIPADQVICSKQSQRLDVPDLREAAFPVPWNLPGPAARSVPARHHVSFPRISSYCCIDMFSARIFSSKGNYVLLGFCF